MLFRLSSNTISGAMSEKELIVYCQLVVLYGEEELLTFVDWKQIEFAE